MRKAIILLNGTPEAKNTFSGILREIAWTWEINPKSYIRDKAKIFYCDGESDVSKYVSEQLELVNTHFQFEKNYLLDNIRKFNSDDSEIKTFGNKSFDKFLLIIHGVSQDMVEYLKDEYGIFTLNISRKDLNTNIEKYDKVLYSDSDDFSIDVNRTIEILTNGG